MRRSIQLRTNLSAAAALHRMPLRSKSAGFTMVELMLVLALLAVIAGVAWPNVLRMQRQQTLMGASDKVRSLASTARVHAIESGLIWQFRYEPGGHHFLVVPFELEIEAINPNATGGATASGLGRFSKAAGTLPTTVTFAGAPSIANLNSASVSSAASPTAGAGQQLSSELLAGLPDAGKLATINWSGPILFHPNGSAGDAAVDLIDKHHQHVTLTIRGITGGVSLSRLHEQAKK